MSTCAQELDGTTRNQGKIDESIEVVAHIKSKRRKAGRVLVKSATLKNVKKLASNALNKGKWLSDEHIDHAQAMLAKQFEHIGGLQAVCIFVPDGCQCVGTPEKNFVQMLNIAGNH